jgi:hypothetical protein
MVQLTNKNGKNIPKWPQNIPNGHRIIERAVKCKYRTAIKFTNQHLSLQDTTKFILIGIFGSKIHIPSGNPDVKVKTVFKVLAVFWHCRYTTAKLILIVCMYRIYYRSRNNTITLTGFPGANPTTVSYKANVVKVYHATSSLVYFENKNI